MTLDEEFAKYQGQSVLVPGEPEDERSQCVQWVDFVLHDVYGLPYHYGNAIEWWTNPGELLNSFNKITDGSIKKGDIVVFNTKVGSQYGHIDVAMSDGSTQNFTGVDSNWLGDKTVHLVNHVGSQYVLGALRLKGGTMQPATFEQAQQLSQTTLLRKEPMSLDEWNKYHASAKRTYQQLNQDWANSDEAKAARFKCWDYDRLAASKPSAITAQTVKDYINGHLT